MRPFFYLTLLTLFFHKAFCSVTIGDFTFTVVGVFTDKTATTDKKFWFVTMEPQSSQHYVLFSEPNPGLSRSWTATSSIGENQFRFFPSDDIVNNFNYSSINNFSSQGDVDSPNLHVTGLTIQIIGSDGSTQEGTLPASEFAAISF